MPAVIDKEMCNGCETCVDICPTEAITIENEIAVVDEDECTDCGTCVEECPNEAISLSE